MSDAVSGALRRFAGWVILKPRRTIFVAAIAILVLMGGIAKLRYVGDVDSTLPDRSALTHDIRAIRALFGSNDTAVFVVDGANDAARIAAACVLAGQLMSDPDLPPRLLAGVGSTATRLIDNREGDLNITPSTALCKKGSINISDVVAGLGPQAEFLVGKNGALVLYADLRIRDGAYLPFRDRADEYIAKTVAEVPGTSIRMTGQPGFMSAMQVYSQRMSWFFPLIMVVIGVLHYEALRTMQAVVLPLAAGLLATLLTLGTMGWAGLALDEYSATAPILVLAVAAGHSVQLLKRYMEELARLATGGVVTAEANQQALLATFERMAPVLTAAVVTAALCLLSLATFDIQAVARFGIVAAGGLLYALIIELTLIPAIRSIRPPKSVNASFGALRQHWRHLLAATCDLSLSCRPRTLILSAVFVGSICFWGISAIERTESVMEPFSPSVPERQVITALDEQGIGTFAIDVVFDAGVPEGAFDPALLTAAADLEQRLRALDNVAAVASPLAVMQFLKCRIGELEDCAATTISTRGEASQIWTLFSGPGDGYPLIDQEWRYLRLRAFAYSDTSTKTNAIHAAVRATPLPTGVKVLTGGPGILAKASGDGIISATGYKVLVIILVSGIAGALIFRSLIIGALFMIPSSISAATVYAFLGLTGTTLNVATASIAALSVGISVDYLVYFTFRLREYLRAGENWPHAFSDSYQTAGGASLCVATAVAGGYAVLNLSLGFRVHQWLGELIPLAIVSGLAATLVLYPILLNFIRPYVLTGRSTSD